MAVDRERVFDVGERPAPQHHRPLEHHRLRRRARLGARPENHAGCGRDEAVQGSQEHALSRSIRAQHHGTPPAFDREAHVGERRVPAEGHRESQGLEREDGLSHGA
jgi:hypothetical protein